MNKNSFMLTSDECELLVAFESAPSLEKLSESVSTKCADGLIAASGGFL
jgi:hypothetical protein